MYGCLFDNKIIIIIIIKCIYSVGLSNCQIVGLLNRRTIGVSDYRSDPNSTGLEPMIYHIEASTLIITPPMRFLILLIILHKYNHVNIKVDLTLYKQLRYMRDKTSNYKRDNPVAVSDDTYII